MDKRRIKSIFLSIIFILYIVAYKLYLFPNYMKYSELISASFLVLFLAISIKMLGFRTDKPTALGKNVFRTVVFHVFLAFFIMYGLGLSVGFLKNAYSRSLLTLLNNIIAPFLIICFIELIRYVIIWANKDRKLYLFFFTFLLIVFEVCTTVRVIDFSDFRSAFTIFSTIVLPSIAKNVVLSYLCTHIGYKVPIFYRIVMDLYIFVVPIVPNIGDYVHSMVFISLPILIYINTFVLVDERSSRVEPIFRKEDFTFFDIPVMVVLVILIALISGFFPHSMIGVGSESMQPAINKGDAVILKKVPSNVKLKKGNIIAFRKSNVIIIHRITDVQTVKGKTVYITKGDANNGKDAGHVTQKQIKGIVQLRIPYIAYPTVWLTEYLQSNNN